MSRRVSERSRRLEYFPKRTPLGRQLRQAPGGLGDTCIAQVSQWGGRAVLREKGNRNQEKSSFRMILSYEPHVSKLHNKNISIVFYSFSKS